MDASQTISFSELNRVLRKAMGGQPAARPPLPPPQQQPKLTTEAKAVVSGLQQIQRLVEEHERLRHAIRKQRHMNAFNAERSASAMCADTEAADDTPSYLRDEPPTFNLSNVMNAFEQSSAVMSNAPSSALARTQTTTNTSGVARSARGSRGSRGAANGGASSARLASSAVLSIGSRSERGSMASGRDRGRGATVMQREELEVMDDSRIGSRHTT